MYMERNTRFNISKDIGIVQREKVLCAWGLNGISIWQCVAKVLMGSAGKGSMSQLFDWSHKHCLHTYKQFNGAAYLFQGCYIYGSSLRFI